jgi:hypothetical protein
MPPDPAPTTGRWTAKTVAGPLCSENVLGSMSAVGVALDGSTDMEAEGDESHELWGRMQEAAWQRGEVPPVVNREWWALAAAGHRLKAALSAFLEYAEQAEQGGQEPSD